VSGGNPVDEHISDSFTDGDRHRENWDSLIFLRFDPKETEFERSVPVLRTSVPSTHYRNMPRLSRAVLDGVAHQVTQRGVDRQDVFFDAADRQVYLSLVEDNLQDARVEVLAYCLMSNHVHWVVVPERPDSLAILFRRVPAATPSMPTHGAGEPVLLLCRLARICVECAALRRDESGAGAHGRAGRALPLVQRRVALGRARRRRCADARIT
jgi:hypothetical protein